MYYMGQETVVLLLCTDETDIITMCISTFNGAEMSQRPETSFLNLFRGIVVWAGGGLPGVV